MAVQYSNLPYQSTNPSGIGNVIFNQSQDAFETHLQNLQRLDEGEKERQRIKREKQQTTGKLLADIDFNSAGILDSDVPYFQEQNKSLHDFTTQAILHGLDPNTPLGAQAANEMRFRAKQLEIDAEASKAAKAALLAAQREINERPDRYDLDASNTKIAKFRAAPLKDRSNLEEWGQLLVPKKVDFANSMDKYLKDIKPTETSEIEKLPQGGQVVATTKTYSSPELAKAYLQSPERREQAKLAFQNLDAISQQSYLKRATNGDPLQVFAEDYISNKLPDDSKKYGGISYSPMERQYASLWGAQEKEQEDVGYIVDRLSQVLNGNDATYKSANDVVNIKGAMGDMIINAKKSGVLSQMPLGKATVPRYGLDNAGNTVIKDLETFDNKVIDFAWINGKPYVQTAKSAMLSIQGLGERYVPVDEDFLDDLTAGSKNPIKTKEALKKELIKRGLYNGGQFTFAEKTQTTQPTKEVVKVKVKLANGKTGEIPENQLEAFKKKYPDATVIYGR